MTAEGRRLVDEAVAANTAAEHKLLGGLGAREGKQLAELLRKLLAGVEP
jgi:DNA-binding MarR family transcriptional regulator